MTSVSVLSVPSMMTGISTASLSGRPTIDSADDSLVTNGSTLLLSRFSIFNFVTVVVALARSTLAMVVCFDDIFSLGLSLKNVLISWSLVSCKIGGKESNDCCWGSISLTKPRSICREDLGASPKLKPKLFEDCLNAVNGTLIFVCCGFLKLSSRLMEFSGVLTFVLAACVPRSNSDWLFLTFSGSDN